MSYTALYRKFRPKKFSEIVGQDHIIQTLKNQIKSGRVGHAYLLTGGRGTGKTSTAKILARAINCLNPQDGEPCNECEICKASLDGTLTDVVEMDAASNNSVEDIRSIKEKINFLPTLAKYRVYIIDEVHMLSTGAFNALLKTLEEPPEHVKFILATTEPQKLLATILSRCQRFDFKKISNSDLIKRMKIVCEESNIQITDTALNLIATLSEGAARDALSILERCMQDGETNIDENKIKDLVGIPKFVYVHDIIKGIINKDVEKSLEAMNRILDEGKDLGNFLWEMIKHTKDILMYKVSKRNEIYSEEEIKQIAELAEQTSKDELINIIYKLSELDNKMKQSSQKTIIFETEIIKLCMKEEEIEYKPKKEIKVENNVVHNQSQQIPEPKKEIPKVENRVNQLKVMQKQEEAKKKPKMQQANNTKIEDRNIISNWTNVLTNLKKQGKVILYANLINTDAVEIDDMTVGIRFNNGLNSFRQELLQKPENMNVLIKEVSMICGKPMNVKLQDAGGSASKTRGAVQTKGEQIKEEIEPQKKQDEINTNTKIESEEDVLSSLDIPINFIEE